MSATDVDQEAALHVLGLASRSEREANVRRLREDPSFFDSVAFWHNQLVALDASLPVTPPAELKAVIMSVVASTPQEPHSTRMNEAETVTRRAGDAVWTDLGPGIRSRTLFKNAGRQICLLVLEPGAEYEAHAHDSDEECYVLSGDISFGPTQLAAGDFHLARKGSTHQRAYTRGGCTIYLAS